MSAELALQKAIVAALKADADVTALVAGRVYDRVPAGATLPYVHIRNLQGVDDSAECVDGLEVYVDVDAWSNAVGKPEAARVVAAVRSALNHQALTLDEPYALLELAHRDTEIGDGGDGILTRGRITFLALLESE